MSEGAGLTFANTAWLAPVALLWLVAVLASVRGHPRDGAGRIGLGLRLLGLTVLALALLEPAWATPRARPGANHFALLVDTSKSLGLAGARGTLGDEVRGALGDGASSGWQRALGDVFQLKRYRFDARLERVSDFGALAFTGPASHLGAALRGLGERWKGAPLAGVLLFSDGNATDVAALAGLRDLPPIYPVLLEGAPRPDVAVAEVGASETLFEDAPVTIEARIATVGLGGRAVTVELRDDHDRVVETRTLTPGKDGDATLSFRVRPGAAAPAAKAPAPLSAHYRVTATAPGITEATGANNARSVLAPRPRGPTRLLYVGGRPSWEYKYLRRALEHDRVLELAALIRLAPREPKFAFLTRRGEQQNPLYRGFGAGDDAERFDEPVLQRLGTRDADELRAGFPRTAEELFEFQGLVLDDLEAGFFTAAQQALVERFVAERGGGLLMLGGIGSFRRGGYDRTPIGDLLPVYLDRTEGEAPGPARFALSREGWLEAWTRLHDNEAAERARLAAMPAFKVTSLARGLKPGAQVLATLNGARGKRELPALVVQRAGEGRVAALLVGDLWRWGLARAPGQADDLAKFWRQTLRALVADVPPPVAVTLAPKAGDPGALLAEIRVRGRDFRPADGATVELDAIAPDGTRTTVPAEPATTGPGIYHAVVHPRGAGLHRVEARASAADGRRLGQADAGRAIDLDADEHRSVRPNLALLEALARQTGGVVVRPAGLEELARRLAMRPAPVSDLELRPLWHSWLVLLLALASLCAAWFLRRRSGLP